MDQLSHKDAANLIREILQYGSVVFSKHAREQMRSRGYHAQDVYHILKHGEVKKIEENPKGQPKYHVHGEDIEGHKGIVVTAIANMGRLIIVTVLGGVK